jgi:hypothetical protein
MKNSIILFQDYAVHAFLCNEQHSFRCSAAEAECVLRGWGYEKEVGLGVNYLVDGSK